ncbi:MAG: hypothetical protein H0W42_01125 [Gemmatimonadaceae bacterium]|nr:hypothetical protein [Gemmatimonadaceae bacterium]
MKPGLMALMLILAAATCAPARIASTTPRDPGRISQDEIVASLAQNAYEAVVKLRRNFLVSRGKTSLRASDSPLPYVFVDGMRYGPVGTLRLIPASNVAEIRFLPAWEATTVYGTGFMSGVIEVTTRR